MLVNACGRCVGGKLARFPGGPVGPGIADGAGGKWVWWSGLAGPTPGVTLTTVPALNPAPRRARFKGLAARTGAGRGRGFGTMETFGLKGAAADVAPVADVTRGEAIPWGLTAGCAYRGGGVT